MEKLNYSGDLFYIDGWFVYVRRNGQICVLTRDDARMLERAYAKYLEYDAGMTGTARTVEGVRSFEEFGIAENYYYRSTYDVDTLGSPSTDVSFGAVLKIPEKVGDYTINAVMQNSFRGLHITKLILPSCIKKVDRGAFENCRSLTEIVFGEEIPDISDAFKNCPSLRYIDGFLRRGNTIIKADEKLSGQVIIPDGVERIMPEAFSRCNRITSVLFPKSIRNVGNNAFTGCNSLSAIIFPDKVENPVLEESIFNGCSALTHIKLPEGLTVIPPEAFSRCYSLTNVNIPSTVSIIRRWAFDRSKIEKDFEASSENCLYIDNWLISVKEVQIDVLDIKEGTVGIAEYAPHFPRDRGKIGPVHLPASIKYLNNYSLNSSAEFNLDLKNVEYIEHRALYCIRSKIIHVPASCRFFGAENIKDNRRLEDIYFHNPETVIDVKDSRFRSSSSVRVHGYKDSTAQELCEKCGELYQLTFVPIS